MSENLEAELEQQECKEFPDTDPEMQFDAGVCCDCDNDKCAFEPARMKVLRKRQAEMKELVVKIVKNYFDVAVNSKVIDKYSQTDNVFVIKPTQTDETVKIRIGNENTDLKIKQIIRRTNERIDRLLMIMNKVTAYHRHGNSIPKEALDRLSNEQIEMEQWLKTTNEQI
jgi:hypothetical protein